MTHVRGLMSHKMTTNEKKQTSTTVDACEHRIAPVLTHLVHHICHRGVLLGSEAQFTARFLAGAGVDLDLDP